MAPALSSSSLTSRRISRRRGSARARTAASTGPYVSVGLQKGQAVVRPQLRVCPQREEPVALQKRDAAFDDQLPLGEVVVVMSPVAVFVGVLELVEGGILSVEQLPIPPKESLVDHPVRLGHERTPSPDARDAFARWFSARTYPTTGSENTGPQATRSRASRRVKRRS